MTLADRINDIQQWLATLDADEQQAVIEDAHHLFHALPEEIAGTDEGGFRDLGYPRARMAWEMTRLEWRFLASLRDLRDEWDFHRLLRKAG